MGRTVVVCGGSQPSDGAKYGAWAPDAGNPASIPQSQLDAWAAEGVVELLGQVDDMQALFANADIAVLPSYREGLPKSLIEAAACALPLVTTDVPGCREVVADEKDGLLVPVRDAAALAMAIRRLHERPEWARQLGQAARAKALAEFDERIVIARTLDVYRELLPELDIGQVPDMEGGSTGRTFDWWGVRLGLPLFTRLCPSCA